MLKADKTKLVEKLTDELKSSTSAVLVNYSGLTVKAQQDLKKKLKEVDAKMVVIKNTLFALAGKSAKLHEDILTDQVLSGPTALVYTKSDPVAPLQVLNEFAKKFELPHFKVGLVEGFFHDKVSLEKIAKLPGKSVLSGQVVGVLLSPMHALVHTTKSNLQKLVYILSEHHKTQSTKAGA